MVLLQCLKQLIRKRMYIGKFLFRQDLALAILWITKSCNLIHLRSLENILFNTDFINYRGRSIGCAKKSLASCSCFQKVLEYIQKKWKITSWKSCLQKIICVNVFKCGKNYSERNMSNIWFTRPIVNKIIKGVIVFSNQRNKINILTVFYRR